MVEILEAMGVRSCVRGVQKAKTARFRFVLYMRTPSSSNITLGIVVLDVTPYCAISITRVCVLCSDILVHRCDIIVGPRSRDFEKATSN